MRCVAMTVTSTAALRQRLFRRLLWQQRVHDPVHEPRNTLPTLSPLRRWQTDRLAGGFRDFLADPRKRPAAEFFLTDLYSDRDFSGRDRDVAKVMPLMARLLPENLLIAATDTLELAVLSHAFDLRLAEQLAKRSEPLAAISVEDYAAAYRATGCERLRRHQIALIVEVGQTLDAAVKRHGVYRLLKASRLPARLAGLSELQGFLERGFSAFDHLGGAEEFLDAIAAREFQVSERLFAGHPAPFSFGDAQPNSSSR